MKNIDWKNIVAAAFFVTALIVSGIGQANELNPQDPRAQMLCDCARSGYSQPHCKVLENTPFPGASDQPNTNSHGVMGRQQLPIPPQSTPANN